MSKPITITKEEFMSLKSGDIVLCKGRYIHTIQSGPGDYPPGQRQAVDVTKVRPSRYKNPLTVRFWADVNREWVKVGAKNTFTLNSMEHERMLAMGFDPCRDLLKQLKATRRCDKRMSRKPIHPKIKPLVKQ